MTYDSLQHFITFVPRAPNSNNIHVQPQGDTIDEREQAQAELGHLLEGSGSDEDEDNDDEDQAGQFCSLAGLGQTNDLKFHKG